jgi:hypothetical protein
MKELILLSVLLAAPQQLLLSGSGTATIKKWEMETYDKGTGIFRKHLVYFLDSDGTQLVITRKSRTENKPELQPGDKLQVRIVKNDCIVTKPNGKKENYEIVAIESN